MARYLSIDWEQQQLHVVQATTARGGVRLEQALSWTIPEPLTPAAAEGIGKKLREALKEANVAAAPVLACVGRERVILKELRYPAVPASEEPAIVRFQAAKELTESPEDSIIDYTPMGNGDGAGERHALAVIVRKEVVNSLQGLCRGLGMKLLAVTPRPAAVIGALNRSRHGKVPVGAVEALLTIGPRWADLSILRGQSLLFARSLGVGPALEVEVKRSLNVFNAAADNPVEGLFVASDDDATALCGRLQEQVGVPVQYLDSFLPEDAVQVDKARRGRFTAAIGLVQRWAEKPELGINFISPKEPKPVANPRTRQYVMAGVMAAIVVLFVLVFGNIVIAGKKEQIQDLNREKLDAETSLKNLAQESADIAFLKDWDNTSVSWIDELYDLTARFPDHKGFRINSLTANAAKKTSAKDKFVASMTLTGVAPALNANDITRVNELVAEINKSSALVASIQDTKHTAANQMAFQLKVDVMHQGPEKYILKLDLKAPKSKGPAVAGAWADNEANDGEDE